MIYELYGFDNGKMKRVDIPENHQKNNLAVGTILQLNGYNNPKYVIVKNLGIDEKFPSYGAKYLVVNLDTLEQKYFEAYLLKFIEEKKDDRIQTYILKEKLSLEETFEIFAKSEEKRKIKEKQEQEKRETLQALEEKGRELFKKYIPENAKALIVARYEIDKCDSMTDYFNTETKETVILGYSFHTRDLFSEMRKFADRIPETKHLAEKNPKFEHREKYAWGAGYYLKAGNRYSTGWKIEKERKWRGDWDKELYIAMAKRCIFENLPTENQENKTIGKCKISNYKGHPIITLPNGFTFGLSKAKAILENIEEIRRFVEDNK